MRSRIMYAGIAALVATARLGAQAAPADTTPFHQGQWAAQFVAGTQFVSAGVLRFRSPTSAWLLDGSFSYNRSKTTATYTPDTQRDWNGGFTLRVGVRTYRPAGPSANFFGSYGLLGSGGGSSSSAAAGYSTSQNQWGAGLFAEIGANYMITSHFSLGAAAGLQARYMWLNSSNTTPAGTDTWSSTGLSVSGALLSLNLGIYF